MKYTSIRGFHSFNIEIDISNKNSLLSVEKITLSEPVELALLLKKISCDLIKLGIQEIILQIYEYDWEEVFKHIEEFKYINKNEEHNFINISVSTEYFADAYMNALTE